MDKIAKAIREWMVSNNKTLSTAESCTGGRIAAMLTSVSGSSDYYQGGMVVYQNWMKEKYLGVKAETIREHDVVSEEVVREMVAGCLKQFGTDYAICSTGYVGTNDGTVWLGWGCKGDIHTHCIHVSGNREENTALATRTAVEKMKEWLKIPS